MCSYVEADRILSFNSREFIEAGDDKPCAAIAVVVQPFPCSPVADAPLKSIAIHRRKKREGGSVIGFDAVVDGQRAFIAFSSPASMPIPPRTRLERKRSNEPTSSHRCEDVARSIVPSIPSSHFFLHLLFLLQALFLSRRRKFESNRRRIEISTSE